ncbi:CDP-glucose 4,6-dehydratase [Desulfovibrio litoralis]|uniref:CDP-glucose 4,6-dehydratase n=1 Tax=Desulfovibrio litoralis TaxID=466107 RepID=UPI0009355493|nr:CDP-glucose 4,6-dehydratase [Desulfovibrio litoralis]
MFNGVYKNTRVLVTGHTGFKGSWLTAWLLSLGAEVAGYSLEEPISEPNNFEVLNLKKRIKHYIGDVRDLKTLSAAIQEFKPEIIFHLAAQALVRPSYVDPVATFEINAVGTLNVLESARLLPNLKALVMITSDKCYRNDEWVFGYRETDHLGGNDPYSASKACAEIIIHSYIKSFFSKSPKAVSVRAGNVIGGGDWGVDRIVPDCAKSYAANTPVNIRSPWATRPWQHVLEPLSGYLWTGAKLLLNDEYPIAVNGEAFNFGPPSDVNQNVASVVESLSTFWTGFESRMNKEDIAGKKECTLLKLCCDKSLAHLNWKACLEFKETIAFTAEWYKTYYAKDGKTQDMYEYTLKQIKNYTQKAQERGIFWASLKK